MSVLRQIDPNPGLTQLQDRMDQVVAENKFQGRLLAEHREHLHDLARERERMARFLSDLATQNGQLKKRVGELEERLMDVNGVLEVLLGSDVFETAVTFRSGGMPIKDAVVAAQRVCLPKGATT